MLATMIARIRIGMNIGVTAPATTSIAVITGGRSRSLWAGDEPVAARDSGYGFAGAADATRAPDDELSLCLLI